MNFISFLIFALSWGGPNFAQALYLLALLQVAQQRMMGWKVPVYRQIFTNKPATVSRWFVY
ncbi:hypothetical protein [Pseudomonas mandelii]|uniref:hypothetical protein n=1 Tax=Pseudomonas mandelii TaxID=75612 RepID=UPI00209FF29D|nr:hypothetical protein [Pseudomonas mandelii]MCO8314276.1 hypothetical protein [Pseudomonas mandelii]